MVALSPRERQCLELIGHGYSNAAIAERMGLKVQNVKNLVYSMMQKTGARSRLQLVRQVSP